MSIDRPTASEALSGGIWHPEEPSPPPAVFAVHDEGDGILALYARSFPTSALAALLEAVGAVATDLVEVSPRWGVQAPVRSLDALEGRLELEIVHSPDARAIEHSILVDPAQALPEGGLGRFALHRAFDGHAIVFAREAGVLEAALRAYLDGWTRGSGLASPPAIPHRALRELSEPLPHEAWREAHLVRHRRHCVLDLATHGAGDADGERWVGRSGGEWRIGWSW